MTVDESSLHLIVPMDVLAQIGELVRLARQREGLTQGELSRKAGVPASTISRLERMGLASTDTLMEVLFALNLIDSVSGFLLERLRLLKFPKTLADDSRAPQEIRRVRHRKDEQ